MTAVIPAGLVAAIASRDDELAYIIGSDEGCVAVWSLSSAREVDVELPVGLRVLGILVTTTMPNLPPAQLADFTAPGGDAYALVYERETETLGLYAQSTEDDALVQIPITVVATLGHCATSFTSAIKYSILRCHATLPLSWTPSFRDAAFDDLRAMLLDPEATFFELPRGDIVSQDARIVSLTPAKDTAWTVAEACAIASPRPAKGDDWGSAARAPIAAAPPDDRRYGRVTHVQLLHSLTPRSRSAPALRFPAPARENTELTLDVVLCLPSTAPLRAMLAALVRGLTRQLAAAQHQAPRDARAIACRQFPLRGGALHPVGIWATDGADMDAAARSRLHQLFAQPLVPVFRPPCAWLPAMPPPEVLVNVHVGVPSAGVAGGQQSLVDGDYGYYHYLQQRTNDKGWGCAYRSLQTLASWCVLNHYSTVAVPSHREIQETLIKIGDKPPGFLGSRDWIGSVEVGFVLDERYSMSFRSLHCASGADLPTLAPELARHFQEQGTPVMLGGASLAFTILGVDWNAASGDVAFLILDPHYTGPDDLATIQTKTVALEGYKGVPCGWRKPQAFARSCFYNLCLPQRPALH
ncbi:Ufm1-specific protease [Achlya hypogyna]|uniref:Ufm1-specific protease n=1 Tax=Achlya hypogyna TaxID=1202772 RepID=A0A1V9YAI6_ACHHY|nr:Ufm1-specific protease [Achlya hypogyna]